MIYYVLTKMPISRKGIVNRLIDVAPGEETSNMLRADAIQAEAQGETPF